MGLFFICSCGYHFEGSGSLPGGITKIKVMAFDNRSGYSRITSSLRDEFIYEFSKKDMIASDESETGFGTLNGEIVSINVSNASKTSSDTAYERRVSIVVNILVKDKKGKPVFERKNISENYVFESSSGQSSGFGVPLDAIDEVANKLAKRVASVITSDF